MSLGGFAGATLRVDLSAGLCQPEPLDQAAARDYLGGLGLCIGLLRRELTPGTPALDPANPVVLGVGPLVGSDLPASSRVYAVAKLPAAGAVGWCGGGGLRFGCGLKNAGFDHLIISGRAAAPVYLLVQDGRAELRDASHLWGLGIEQTVLALGRTHPGAGVLAIGPGGENAVRFAMASIDGMATIGRGGLGALLGSKNLKAVVALGSLGVRVAHRPDYRRLSRRLFEAIRDYPHLKHWQDLGLLKSLPVVDEAYYRAIKKRRVACVSCPIGDKDIVAIPSGPHAGQRICTSSAANLFTPNVFGLKGREEAMRLSAVLDELGLDTFEFFAVTRFAARLAQAGVIGPELLPEPLDAADLASLERWAARICAGQGLGAVMALGLPGLVEAFGSAAAELAPAMIKGLSPYVGPGGAVPWNLFGSQELGQALDPRGPHVGASGSPTYFASRPLEVFPRHLRRMGVPDEAIARILPGLGTDGADLKVGVLLKYSHRWFATLGSLGLCARAQINRFYDAQTCAEAYQAVTGLPTDLPRLAQCADRAWTALRLLNLAEGQGRAADALPRQWFGPEGFKDYVSQRVMPAGHFEAMVDDYYAEQGWSQADGAPTAATLARLGLDQTPGRAPADNTR